MMNHPGHDYLENAVLTASPQKLQLLLIEGAIRFSLLAQKHWQSGDIGAGSEALIHSQQIVAEMITGLNGKEQPELVRRIASVYLFIHRTLVEANLEHDQAKLRDALRILEIERETWRQACQGSEQAAPATIPIDDRSLLGQSFVA